MANRLAIAVFLWVVLPNAAGAWSVDREALKAAIERDRRAERCEATRLVRSGGVLFAADGQAISEPAQVTALYDAAGRPAPSRILPVYEGGQHTVYEVVVLGMHFPPRIVPAYRDARLVGWKFVGVGTESTAARLGFRTSDVIVAIDGRAVVDVADVLQLKEELLAGAEPHQVEVERRGVRRMVEWWW